MADNNNYGLTRLEDLGHAILELQQLIVIKHNPLTTEEEREHVVPVVASLRDALVQHLIKAAAVAKKGPAALAGMIPAAQQHEYVSAVVGLLRAVRELFPDALEFSSALIACSNRSWWGYVGAKMQPLEQLDGECLLEMSVQHLHRDNKNHHHHHHAASATSAQAVGGQNNESRQNDYAPAAQLVDTGGNHNFSIANRFSAAEAVADVWWDSVLVSVCGVQSIGECFAADALPTHVTQESVLVSAIATMCLYVLGPPVSSTGEPVAAAVQKRAVAMVTSLPQGDGAAVVRAVARLVCKHLILLSRKRSSSKGKRVTTATAAGGGCSAGGQTSSSDATSVFFEHQGTLALHRWFSLLAAIRKTSEQQQQQQSSSSPSSILSSCPATPPPAFVLPLVGLREILSRRDVLEAAMSSGSINWIRKLFTAPSYFASSSSSSIFSSSYFGAAAGAAAAAAAASMSSGVISCDLDIFATSLLHCSLRASRIDAGVSEHSERTECHSANFFLHALSSKLCSASSATAASATLRTSNNSDNATGASPAAAAAAAAAASSDGGFLGHLSLSRSTIQLVRIALLHDGIPFPPPRATESFGLYCRFCPCCLHLCMEVRRNVSVAGGLVLPLSDPDIEPWARMVWRDGPNSFTGSATSFREDSPARKRAMPSVQPSVFVASSSGEEEEEDQETDQVVVGGQHHQNINSSNNNGNNNNSVSTSSQQRRRRQIRETASVTQAELPRLFTPVQRAAAVFRLALIDGGCAAAASAASISSSSWSSSSTLFGGGSGSVGEPGEAGRVPAVIWPCAADGLLEALEHDHHHVDNATWLVVASAATVAACASLLRFPCDLALSRLTRVMQCRARKEEQLLMIAQQQQQKQGLNNNSSAGASGRGEGGEGGVVLLKLLAELGSSHWSRPRTTSELFDNVNPLVFAEWEKLFSRCCEEALTRQPVAAANIVWQQQHHQHQLAAKANDDSNSTARRQQQQQQHSDKKRQPPQRPRPSRESSLSSRNNGTAVLVWMDSTMSSSFLFGVEAAHEQHQQGHVDANKPKRAQRQSESNQRTKSQEGEATARQAGNADNGADDDEEDDDDVVDNNDRGFNPWVPIWVTHLPEGSAVAAGRHGECVVPRLTACCGIVCGDTALSCPLRPNDLVFFTPACPEDEAQAVARQQQQQPEVIFPRVVLRAWRLVPGASALVPNLAVRRCEGTRRDFRLTLTSGEEGSAPLSLRCGSACHSDSASVAAWPMAQWFAVMRHLGRNAASSSAASHASQHQLPSSFASAPAKQLEQKQTAAIFYTFGPGFAAAASTGILRSFWSSLRDVSVPFLMGSAPLYWTVSRPVSSSNRDDPAATGTGAALFPPPYLALGGNFGVTTEFDAWRGTASLDVADVFLEG